MTAVLDFNTAKPLASTEQARRSYDVERLRGELHGRAREFVQWLFPCAVVHRSGRYAVVGDTTGSPGESLNIQLSGSKAGFWRDWNNHGDEGKDLIGLFIASMGWDRTRDFPKAIEAIAKEFLNAEAPEWSRPLTKVIRERAREHEHKPRPEINDRPPPTETYAYTDFTGSIIGLIRRHEYDEIDEKTGKQKKTFTVWDAVASKAQAPTPRPLYRIPDIVRASHIVFVEGEKKANALASVGIEATCIMFGSNAPLDKVDWTPITGKDITIWPDNDQSGLAFGARLAGILSALGCRVAVVTPPADKPTKWDAADCLAEGGNPNAIIGTAVEWGNHAQQSHAGFRLYTLDELEDLPPPSWVIQDVLVENGLTLLWAGSDSFKTFCVIDLAMCVATGASWHGRDVVSGPVVYIAAEDESGVKMRMIGWRETRGKGLPRPDVRIFRDGFTLAGPDNDQLITAITTLPQPPKLIVIDTLARTFGAGNENQTADMNAYVLAADKLRGATGANVLIIHHTGVNTDRERGNMALRGACNTIITIARTGDRIRLVNTPPKGKQKNAEPFADIHLRMQKVHFTLKDKEHSTLIVMADESAPAGGGLLKDKTQTQDAQPLGQIEKSILAALVKGARSGRDLGFTSLQATIKSDKGSLARSLRNLIKKGLLEEIEDASTGSKSYRQVQPQ